MTPKEILIKALEAVMDGEEFVCLIIMENDGYFENGDFSENAQEAMNRFTEMHKPEYLARDGGWFDGKFEGKQAKRIAALKATIATFE
jgi:hypothetical protein